MSDQGDVIFSFENKALQITQSFGVNLKKYLAHQIKKNDASRYFVKQEYMTDIEKQNNNRDEGHYIFVPQWDDQAPKQFSSLNDDITYQSGQLVEQWSLFYKNCTN